MLALLSCRPIVRIGLVPLSLSPHGLLTVAGFLIAARCLRWRSHHPSPSVTGAPRSSTWAGPSDHRAHREKSSPEPATRHAALYGTGRLACDFLREDVRRFGLTGSQWAALLVVTGSVSYLLARRRPAGAGPTSQAAAGTPPGRG